MIDEIKKIDKFSEDNPLYDIQVLSAKEAYILPNIRHDTLAGFKYEKESSDDVLAIYKKDKQVVIAIRGSQTKRDWVGNYFNLMSGRVDSSTAFGKVINNIRAYVNKPENKDLDVSLTGHSLGGMLSFYTSYILTLDNLATNRQFPSVSFALGKTVFSEGEIPSAIQTVLKLMANGDATGRDALNNLIIGKMFDKSVKQISKISPIDLTNYMAIMTPNIGIPALVASGVYAFLEEGRNIIILGDVLDMYEKGFSKWWKGSKVAPPSEKMKNQFKKQLKEAGVSNQIEKWAKSIPESVLNIAIIAGFSAGGKKLTKMEEELEKFKNDVTIAQIESFFAEDQFKKQRRNYAVEVGEDADLSLAQMQMNANNLKELSDAAELHEGPAMTPATLKKTYSRLEELEKSDEKSGKLAIKYKNKLREELTKTKTLKRFKNGLAFIRKLVGFYLLYQQAHENMNYNDAVIYQKMMRDGVFYNGKMIKPVRKFISYNVKDNHLVGVDAGLSKAITKYFGVDPLSEGSRQFFANPNNRENGNVKLVEVKQNYYDNQASLLPSHSLENYISPKYRSKDYIKKALKGMYKEQDSRKKRQKRQAILNNRDEL